MSAAYIQMHVRLILIMKENTLNPDQTAPKGAVLSGFILFKIEASKVHELIKKQTSLS